MALLRGRSKRNHAFVPVQRPRARTDDLVIEQLEDEVLVYDPTRHRAHCLGSTAARVWRACDGNRDVSALSDTLDLSVDVVRRALDELEALDLLDSQGLDVVHSSDGNGHANGNGITRRQFGTRSAAVGAGLATVPLVLSVNVSPASALTVTPFVCNTFTSGDCGTSAGCGSLMGCCCCCTSGQCKTCAPTNLCAPPGFPCVDGGTSSKCSNTEGPNAPTPRGCCSVNGASNCPCGFDVINPKSGAPAGNTQCCDTSMPLGGGKFATCTPSSANATCVPCCANVPLTPTATPGCCTSATVNNC
jgi:hypothetical protein